MVDRDDVRDALDHLSTVEFDNSEVAGGIRVAVHDDDVGLFWQAVRQNGFDVESKRIGDSLVAHIEAEPTDSLADLFG